MSLLRRAAKAALRRAGYSLERLDPDREAAARVADHWLRDLGIRTVIDVGASVGNYSARARALFPGATIVAFEPLPDSFAELVQRFAGDPRFRAFPLALGDRAGDVTFNKNAYAGASSMLPLADAHRRAYAFAQQVEPIRVRSDTLDAALAGQALTPPVLLKMDAQGGEAAILRGAAETLRRTQLVYSEVCFVELYQGQALFGELHAMLELAGFAFAGIEHVFQSCADGTFLHGDAYFLRRA